MNLARNYTVSNCTDSDIQNLVNGSLIFLFIYFCFIIACAIVFTIAIVIEGIRNIYREDEEAEIRKQFDWNRIV